MIFHKLSKLSAEQLVSQFPFVYNKTTTNVLGKKCKFVSTDYAKFFAMLSRNSPGKLRMSSLVRYIATPQSIKYIISIYKIYIK